MRSRSSRPRRGPLVLLGIAAALGLAWLCLPQVGAILAAHEILAAAHARDLDAWWKSLVIHPPFGASLRGLSLVDARGNTLLEAGRVDVAFAPMSVLALHPRIAHLEVADAAVALPPSASAESDTITAAPVPRHGRLRADHLPHIRETARALVRVLVGSPERLPNVTLTNVTVTEPDTAEGARTLTLASLRVQPDREGTVLDARGVAPLEGAVPFRARIADRRDGRLTGRLVFATRDAEGPDSLALALDATVHRDASPPSLTIVPGSRLTVGTIPFQVAGLASSREPHVAVRLDATGIDEPAVLASFPRSMLGPLASAAVRGSFDYSVEFDLDLSQPDSVDFDADVTPHGLALDPPRSLLAMTSMSGPFTATIHLPHGRLVQRELSPANPHYRPLGAIDSTLVHAVLANEDGGFFRHRGFNTEAVRDAFVEDLHAGGYRRGAGTITMQLARNLYLGHERSLVRKAQEVALTWMLEHLAGLGKARLLEIYFNIIEWGPDVQGADEATEFYFGHDAGHVTPDEALFLASVVPSPSRWRARFDRDGALRGYAREQMHFIGRAMVRKGWLAPEALPPADDLRVTLSGPAGAAFATPADTGSARALEPAARPGTPATFARAHDLPEPDVAPSRH